jgi:hypothetical protein
MRYQDAVLELAHQLGDTAVTGAVTASANVVLRGYDVEPRDVDIKTDADGVRAIVDSVPGSVVRPVVPPGTTDADWVRSHFGVLELAGETVELVRDAEFWDPEEERWVASPPVEGNRESRPLDGIAVPVLSLEYERQRYRARGDDARRALLSVEA